MSNATLPSAIDLAKTSSYVVLCIFQLVPYLVILWILYREKKTYGAPVYKIIFHLGITDIIQLIFHCSALPLTIWTVSKKSWIVKVCTNFFYF
uniref:Serpentine receptor class gamma n=1 Tax=Acrobeloides nanus TaxID=290746 RepID=A0A914DJD0_9BILA